MFEEKEEVLLFSAISDYFSLEPFPLFTSQPTPTQFKVWAHLADILDEYMFP